MHLDSVLAKNYNESGEKSLDCSGEIVIEMLVASVIYVMLRGRNQYDNDLE